jgi:hypothetical protein
LLAVKAKYSNLAIGPAAAIVGLEAEGSGPVAGLLVGLGFEQANQPRVGLVAATVTHR